MEKHPSTFTSTRVNRGGMDAFLKQMHGIHRAVISFTPHTMYDRTTTGTLALGCVVVLYIGRRVLRSLTSYPLPPGPPGLPWVGNVIGVNTSAPWVMYAEWARTYGRSQHVQLNIYKPISLQATWSILDCWERISSSSTRKRSQGTCSRTGPGTIQAAHTSSSMTCQALGSFHAADLNSSFKVWSGFQFCFYAIRRSLATPQALFPSGVSARVCTQISSLSTP